MEALTEQQEVLQNQIATLSSQNDALLAEAAALQQKIEDDAAAMAVLNRTIINQRRQLRRWKTVRDWYNASRDDLVAISDAQALLIQQMGGLPVYNALPAIYRWSGPFPTDLGAGINSWQADFQGHPAWYYLPGSSRDGGIPSIYTEPTMEWPKWFHVWSDPAGKEHVSGIGAVAIYGAYTYEYGIPAYHALKRWALRLDQIFRFSATCLQASFTRPPVIPRLRRSSL